MKITVPSKDTEEIHGMWEGKPTLRHGQWCMLQQGGFVLSFQVRHNEAKDAYAPGEYELDPTSFSTRNGQLSVERVKLRPVKAVAVSPARSA